MIKITDRELAISKALVKLTIAGKDTFTLDWLCMEVPTSKQTDHARSSMAATLRNFASKLYQEGGYRLKRTSSLGQGNKATYEFAGDFERLLKKEAA